MRYQVGRRPSNCKVEATDEGMPSRFPQQCLMRILPISAGRRRRRGLLIVFGLRYLGFAGRGRGRALPVFVSHAGTLGRNAQSIVVLDLSGRTGVQGFRCILRIRRCERRAGSPGASCDDQRNGQKAHVVPSCKPACGLNPNAFRLQARASFDAFEHSLTRIAFHW